MAAHVEVVALILLGASQAADDVVLLEHGGLDPVLGQLIGGGQPRGARADDHRAEDEHDE